MTSKHLNYLLSSFKDLLLSEVKHISDDEGIHKQRWISLLTFTHTDTDIDRVTILLEDLPGIHGLTGKKKLKEHCFFREDKAWLFI